MVEKQGILDNVGRVVVYGGQGRAACGMALNFPCRWERSSAVRKANGRGGPCTQQVVAQAHDLGMEAALWRFRVGTPTKYVREAIVRAAVAGLRTEMRVDVLDVPAKQQRRFTIGFPGPRNQEGAQCPATGVLNIIGGGSAQSRIRTCRLGTASARSGACGQSLRTTRSAAKS
eukprot:4557528-Pleurochrysis_carterae.AAC.2